MSVQFILGDHPTEKRRRMIDHVYNHLTNNPKERMIFLVPDNVKYEAETMILEQFRSKQEETRFSGMIRLQVFSFSRLAWYILQDKPVYQKQQLTESGLAMLMKNILQEEEKNLTIYRGTSQHSGFIERLVTLFMELRNGKIKPGDLIEIAEDNKGDSEVNRQDFQRKMNDLSFLYQRYDERLSDKYVEKEDLYGELIDYLYEMKESLKDVHVVVDHYEHFSAQEQELLLVLARTTKNVSILLTLDEERAQQENDIYNPFYRSTKTYKQLLEFMTMNQVTVLDNLNMGSKIENKNNQNKEVLTVADYWMKSSQATSMMDLVGYKNQTYENLEVWAAEDKKAELMHIATRIRKLVASGNYRYKDFQIMTRDLDGYRLNVEADFAENEIPYFIDQAESMAQHPILEFVVSLFNLKKKHYRINDIFRFLRTELYCPVEREVEENLLKDLEKKNLYFKDHGSTWRSKVDIAENVALAYGYQGSEWVNDADWHYARFDTDGEFSQNEKELQIQETANEVRRTFRENIVPFINRMDKANTNSEIARSLYEFMIEIGVVDQIQHWRDQLIEDGALEEARKHEQAWDTFINLLDEFVEVLGDEQWDIDSFISIMETGFEQATFSMVPPTIDQVLVTNFDLPKIQYKRVVFLIGLTDTQLPKTPSSSSLLTDEDRQMVEDGLSTDKYLATSEVESFANEPFAMYLALLQSNEKLFFTFPLTNEESKENRISPYLSRIVNGLDLIVQIKHGNAIAEDPKDPSSLLDFVGSMDQTFGQMIISLRHAVDDREQPTDFWVKLFEDLYNPNEFMQNRVVNSLSHKNIPVPLTDELAEELYGQDLYLSVSQLETFYSDPYSHFLIYGLRLKERQVQELSALETGNFFHDALDYISSQLFKLEKDISTLTDGEIDKITMDVFNLLVDSKKYRLSQSSNRMQFIFRQLATTVKRMVWSIVNQSKRSELRVNQTELLFGRLGANKGIEGLSFPLKNGGRLNLRGKVDRVDTFKVDKQLYAGIVDYKSSQTAFDYQKIYYGLMMQMITYLDTVLENSEEIFNEPAKGIGAFYSRVHHPFIDLKDLKKQSLEEELLKQYKFDGLIIDQNEILEAVDTKLEMGHSPLYPIQLLKSGAFKHDKILTEEEFKLLINYNREMIIEAGNRILSGENKLAPFDDAGLYTPSVRGSYQAISQFDALLPENNYQDMLKLKKNDFFSLLNEKYNPKEEK